MMIKDQYLCKVTFWMQNSDWIIFCYSCFKLSKSWESSSIYFKARNQRARIWLERSMSLTWALKLFLSSLRIIRWFDDGSWCNLLIVCVSYCGYAQDLDFPPFLYFQTFPCWFIHIMFFSFFFMRSIDLLLPVSPEEVLN